jgi:A/G-specific adenine glycosylase
MDWRETDDPYRIWVSEIMLQQTRAGTVTPYYRRFLSAFLDLETLACALLDKVLKLWEGMGYYSRARNLHRTAGILLAEHEGRLPDSVEALMALPGIGRSTAGAIAAIAFRKDVPILDSNVKRVVARLYAVREDIGNPAVARRMWGMSRGLILKGKGRETALALMDLGSTVCTPRNPRCGECPMTDRCEASRRGLQGEIPRRMKKKPLPHHDVVAAVIGRQDGKILIGRRPENGLLGGLWGFPGGKREPDETLVEALSREIGADLEIGYEILGKIDPIRHGYSHFRISLHAFRCRMTGGSVGPGREWRWVGPMELEGYAIPRAERKLLERILETRPLD